MKQKRTSAVLTLILGLSILAFLAFSHVVGSLVSLGTPSAGFAGFMEAIVDRVIKLYPQDFTVFEQTAGFVIAALLLAVALVLAIVWAIRLLVYRRRAANLFSPLLFFLAIVIGIVLVSADDVIEAAFSQQASQIATAYWFVLGVVIVVLALHLVVVGLASSGRVKDASILSDVEVEEFIQIAETKEEPVIEEKHVEEPVEEHVVPEDEEDEIVIREEIIPAPVSEHKSEVVETAEIDLTDKELHALIRKIAIEEINKRPAPEKVVIREVVQKDVQPKPEPKAEVKPEPKVEPKPAKVEPVVRVEKEKPVVKKPAPVVVPQPAKKVEKVERIAFPERMQVVEEPVKADYNVLKSYLLSYGLNSRVSNVADSFRLGRILYARLTNSGNSGLKLYLPIDMDDYKDSKVPLKSAAGLKQYEDVPVFIYVRSDLSMKRAKELIDDVMLKKGIARKEDVVDVDHVKALRA